MCTNQVKRASTATLVRLKYLPAYASDHDYQHKLAPVGLWSVIEAGIGIIAGSLATLRPLCKYLPGLSCFGSEEGSRKTSATKLSAKVAKKRQRKSGVKTDIKGNAKSGEGPDHGAGPNSIMRESHIMVTSEHGQVGRFEAWDARGYFRDVV
jgi:hypothetical protein